MRVFVTGGTGYIGSAIVDALVRGGHQVDALVRHAEKAAIVQARGARPLQGDLATPASFAAAAAAADGVIHAAIEYTARGPQLDTTVLDACLVGSGRPRFFIYTSGVWVLGDTKAPADETAMLRPAEISAWRVPQERRVLEAAGGGLRTVVVRPGIVYGGHRGIVADLVKDAANGLVRVVGSGANHWPLIYARDLGDLYVRLAATESASGVFHANDEGDERVSDLVAAISAQVDVAPSVRHLPIGEARKKMGPYADALALDQIVRSPRARALGWQPSLRSVAGNAPRLFEEWRRGREAA